MGVSSRTPWTTPPSPTVLASKASSPVLSLASSFPSSAQSCTLWHGVSPSFPSFIPWATSPPWVQLSFWWVQSTRSRKCLRPLAGSPLRWCWPFWSSHWSRPSFWTRKDSLSFFASCNSVPWLGTQYPTFHMLGMRSRKPWTGVWVKIFWIDKYLSEWYAVLYNLRLPNQGSINYGRIIEVFAM